MMVLRHLDLDAANRSNMLEKEAKYFANEALHSIPTAANHSYLLFLSPFLLFNLIIGHTCTSEEIDSDDV